MVKRGRLEVYGDILAAIRDEATASGSARLTRIQLRCNMPYDRFKEYLLVLRERGLVKFQESSEVITAVEMSESGIEYLANYERVQKFVRLYGL